MATEKKSNALIDALKKQAIGILIGIVALAWTSVKELISTGAEVKTKNLIINVVMTDAQIKIYFDSLVKEEISKTINNPVIWMKILGNENLTQYTDKKASELRQFVNNKMDQVDSIQKAFYSTLGMEAGERDENVMKYLGAMIREYRKKHTLETYHSPTM